MVCAAQAAVGELSDAPVLWNTTSFTAAGPPLDSNSVVSSQAGISPLADPNWKGTVLFAFASARSCSSSAKVEGCFVIPRREATSMFISRPIQALVTEMPHRGPWPILTPSALKWPLSSSSADDCRVTHPYFAA